MYFSCPQCGHKVDLRKTLCRQCGQRLTLGAVLLYYLRRGRARVRRSAVVRCPTCQRKVPITSKTCPHCEEAMTVQLAVQTTLGPPLRWGRHRWSLVSPQARHGLGRGLKFLIQLAFLGASGALLWHQLLTFPVEMTWLLLGRAALSAVLVAVFGLLSFWVVPWPTMVALARRPAPVVRLALVCNSLSLLLWLHTVIAEWWLPALVLAGAFAVLGLAAYVFARLLWPRVTEVRKAVEESRSESFDPSKAQGRSASNE